MPWIGLEPGSTRTPIWPAPDQLVDPHSPSFRFAIKPQFRKCTQVPQFLEFFKLAPTIYMYTWCKLSAFFSSHPPCLLRPSQFLKNQTTIEGAPSSHLISRTPFTWKLPRNSPLHPHFWSKIRRNEEEVEEETWRWTTWTTHALLGEGPEAQLRSFYGRIFEEERNRRCIEELGIEALFSHIWTWGSTWRPGVEEMAC